MNKQKKMRAVAIAMLPVALSMTINVSAFAENVNPVPAIIEPVDAAASAEAGSSTVSDSNFVSVIASAADSSSAAADTGAASESSVEAQDSSSESAAADSSESIESTADDSAFNAEAGQETTAGEADGAAEITETEDTASGEDQSEVSDAAENTISEPELDNSPAASPAKASKGVLSAASTYSSGPAAGSSPTSFAAPAAKSSPASIAAPAAVGSPALYAAPAGDSVFVKVNSSTTSGDTTTLDVEADIGAQSGKTLVEHISEAFQSVKNVIVNLFSNLLTDNQVKVEDGQSLTIQSGDNTQHSVKAANTYTDEQMFEVESSGKLTVSDTVLDGNGKTRAIYAHGITYTEEGTESKIPEYTEADAAIRPTIELKGNTVIQNGKTSGQGAGILLNGAVLDVGEGALFKQNKASNAGGAIAASNASTVNIQNASLTDNSSSRGGAIYATGKSEINMSNVTAKNNSSGGGVGGAISLDNSTLEVSGTNIFNENKAGNGAAMDVRNMSTATIGGNNQLNNNIISPAYGSGGAICVNKAVLTIKDNATIANNRVNGADNSGSGGGIAIYNGSTTYLNGNILITNNYAPGCGDGVRVTASDLYITGNVQIGNNVGWQRDLLREGTAKVEISGNSVVYGNVVGGSIKYLDNAKSVAKSTGNKTVSFVDKDQVTQQKTGAAFSELLEAHEGYGWNTASDGTGTFYSRMPAASITLYEVPISSVTYDYGDRTIVVPVGSNTNYTVHSNAPTRYGYVLDGWTDGNSTYNAGDQIPVGTESVMLTPVWSEDPNVTAKYTLTVDDGTQETAAEYRPNTVVTLEKPVRDGYTFNGWVSGSSTYQAGDKYNVSGNATLTAQWTKNVYNVTVAFENSEIAGAANVTSKNNVQRVEDANVIVKELYDNHIELPDSPGIERPGYTFQGWTDGKQTCAIGESYTVTGDATITPYWQGNPYNITYVDGTKQDVQTSNCGDTVTVMTPTNKNDMKFVGWTDGTNIYTPGSNFVVPVGGITLTAVWAPAEEFMSAPSTTDSIWLELILTVEENGKTREEIHRYPVKIHGNPTAGECDLYVITENEADRVPFDLINVGDDLRLCGKGLNVPMRLFEKNMDNHERGEYTVRVHLNEDSQSGLSEMILECCRINEIPQK